VIRGRDYLKMCLHKIGLRKKRAIFAITSISLGVIVVVTANSLMAGIRKAALSTLWTQDIDENVVRMYTGHNPYEYDMEFDPYAVRAHKLRPRFLKDGDFAEINSWKEVLTAAPPIDVEPVAIPELAQHPDPVTTLNGIPDALMEHYAELDASLVPCEPIPVLLGDHRLRFRPDPETGEMTVQQFDRAEWLGRIIQLRVGDNLAYVSPFEYDYGENRYRLMRDEEYERQRENVWRGAHRESDPVIRNTIMTLDARVVGIRSGDDVYIPLEVAKALTQWILSRNRLAAFAGEDPDAKGDYDSEGNRSMREGEYAQGLTVVRKVRDVEEVAGRVDKMGFKAVTRQRAFEAQAEAVENGMRIARRVVAIFALLILSVACALLASTISKIVADSRPDIGLFRALGATRTEIRRLFLGEAALLGLFGTVLGVILGWLLAWGISVWVIAYAHREADGPSDEMLIPDTIFAVDILPCIALLLGAALVAIIAGAYPAFRASSIDPVLALKRE